MSDRSLDANQLELISKQAQISFELLEIDWTTLTGSQAQGQEDGYLTITPGAATTFKYGDAPVWADCTHTGTINVISVASGTDTIDYIRRISMKYNTSTGWTAAIGKMFQQGFVDVSNPNPTLTFLTVDGKFYINLHYNNTGFYLFNSSNVLITSTSVITHDYGMDFAFTNGIYPIDYNGKTFLPLGTFLQFGEVEELVDFQISTMNIVLNGIDYMHNEDQGTYAFDYFNYDAEYQSYSGDPDSKYAVVKLNNPIWRFEVDNYINRKARVYRVYMDHNYQVVGDPLLIFEGYMNKPMISIDPDSGTTIAIECTNQWSDFERRNGRHTNYKEQLSWANSNLSAVDKVFEYTSMSTRQIKWGATNAVVNPPSNLRYTKTISGVYSFLWNPPATAPDTYEIHWTVPSGGTTQIYAVPQAAWTSPAIFSSTYDIKVYAVKDGVRSKAATQGTTAIDLTNIGGAGGFYGTGFNDVVVP